MGSKVRWNGADHTTSYLNPTLLNAQIPSFDIASAGSASITVFNPPPGGGTSGTAIFTISPALNPTPVLATISPSSTNAGGPGFTLTVTGSTFIPGSTVQWNGNNQATTYISSTRLTASIPAAGIASPGTAGVTVFNPSPGGGTSGSLTFTIKALRLKASFTGTPTTGPMPLTVVFTDTSTGNPTRWIWNFGDGTSSNLQNPTHIYRSAGSYTVTASNNAGISTNRKTNYIKVRRNQIILGNVP
jgi:PKD repeat protein